MLIWNSIAAQHKFNLLFIIEKQITNKTCLLIQMVFPICFKIEMNFEIVFAHILLILWSLYILKIDHHSTLFLSFSPNIPNNVFRSISCLILYMIKLVSNLFLFLIRERKRERLCLYIWKSRSTLYIYHCLSLFLSQWMIRIIIRCSKRVCVREKRLMKK